MLPHPLAICGVWVCRVWRSRQGPRLKHNGSGYLLAFFFVVRMAVVVVVVVVVVVAVVVEAVVVLSLMVGVSWSG